MEYFVCDFFYVSLWFVREANDLMCELMLGGYLVWPIKTIEFDSY
jgi:hypothetical protein